LKAELKKKLIKKNTKQNIITVNSIIWVLLSINIFHMGNKLLKNNGKSLLSIIIHKFSVIAPN
jgi:hypothetical protein